MVQITKVFTMQFSPVSLHFLPLVFKPSPQQPVLVYPRISVKHGPTVYRDVTSYSLVEVCRRLGGTYASIFRAVQGKKPAELVCEL